VSVDAYETAILECFLDGQLYGAQLEPWYAAIVNYFDTKETLREWTKDERARFLTLVRLCIWVTPICLNISKNKSLAVFIMTKFLTNAYGGHFGGAKSPQRLFIVVFSC